MCKVARLIAKSPFIPHTPTSKQLHFLALQDLEAFYGGQVGGGKSDSLLIAAAMYHDVPGYNALLLRRTYPELTQADGLITRSKEWFGPTRAKWSEQQATWTFPSSATIRFGHMQHDTDVHKYQGGAYQFVGWDELTGFEEQPYLYLISRLRRLRSSPVPLRVRGASNPGNIGHDWVFERFVADDPMGRGVGRRPFISASLDDNPYLSTEEYKENLQELDEVTRAQLLEGKWIKAGEHQPFRPEFWRNKNRYDPYDPNLLDKVVGRWAFLDTANKIEETNAYSAVVIGELLDDYRLIIRYVTQARKTYDDLVEYVADELEPFAGPRSDDKFRAALIEDAASGTQLIQHFTKPATDPVWLRGKVVGRPPYRGSPQSVKSGKEQAYAAAGLWCKRDCLWLPIPGTVPWDLHGFERQLYRMPSGQFKDMADALAGLVNYLEEQFSAMSTRYYYYGAP